MVAPYAPAQDVREVLELGANLIRYQIVDPSGAAGRMEAYDYTVWVRNHLAYIMDELLPTLEGPDRLVVDLHTPPGGYLIEPGKAPTYAMYTVQPWHRETFKDAWQIIVEWLGDQPKVLAFDLLNEPAGTPHQITALYRNTIKRIRGTGCTVPCIVSTPYGDPARVKDLYVYPKAHNVWYQVHMYEPLNVTHQGVNGFPVGKVYPGPQTGLARMQKVLLPFKRFLNVNHVRGFVGEFSISSYADAVSRANYARDAISCFEEMGVEWCWHAWREAAVWQPSDDVLVTLMKAWEKN
jgi:endoglucanase